MKKIESFKYFLLCLAITAFFACMYAFFFGIESAIYDAPKYILGSLIGMFVIVGLLISVMAFAPDKEKESVKSTKPAADSNEQEKITLDDVIVSDEVKKELEGICNKIPEEKKKALKDRGYKVPKGYLFHGPPGTGKTLLARAIANEAGVNFINISGSELVGAFAGHGAKHVRTLFEEAREKAPCIIFIDEIDSIGTKRISTTTVGADHSSTLNQLLTEMGGFSPSEGITVIAATNCFKALDPALVRPGRFDKKIEIPLPDVKLREKMLEVYMDKAKLDKSALDLEKAAEETEGFSGAGIGCLVNELIPLAEGSKVTTENFKNVLEKLKSEIQKPKNEERNRGGLGALSSLLDSRTSASNAGFVA